VTGRDPANFAFRERDGGGPEVVFVGALSYPPNAQAAHRLATSILPLLRRSVPACRLLLVGQGPDASLRALDDGRTTIVTGDVDDVRPFLGRASAACIPLVSGSGTKYKLLEALSAGVPVACSPLAVEGLEVEHGRHLLVADTDHAMAAALERLLGEPLARTLAAEGAPVESATRGRKPARLDPGSGDRAAARQALAVGGRIGAGVPRRRRLRPFLVDEPTLSRRVVSWCARQARQPAPSSPSVAGAEVR
jgi:glycosyltransferase involved in cell wall biosynthesis